MGSVCVEVVCATNRCSRREAVLQGCPEVSCALRSVSQRAPSLYSVRFRYEIDTGTQHPGETQHLVAMALAIPCNKVRADGGPSAGRSEHCGAL